MLYLDADHGGFKLKEGLRLRLSRAGIAYRDLGPTRPSRTDDYPIPAQRVARSVSRGPRHRGLLICRSGVGMAIVANKVRGVRAVLAADAWTARRARRDEDANVLALGADRLTAAAAWRIVRAWLTAPFRNAARDRRRLREIQRIERARP